MDRPAAAPLEVAGGRIWGPIYASGRLSASVHPSIDAGFYQRIIFTETVANLNIGETTYGTTLQWWVPVRRRGL